MKLTFWTKSSQITRGAGTPEFKILLRLDCDVLRWVHTRWISGRIISSAQAKGANTKESAEEMLRKYYSRNSSIKSQSNSWSVSSRYHSLVDKIIRTIIKSAQTAGKPLSKIAKFYLKKIQGSKQGRTHHTSQDENFSSYRCSFSYRVTHRGTKILLSWKKKSLNHISLI